MTYKPCRNARPNLHAGTFFAMRVRAHSLIAFAVAILATAACGDNGVSPVESIAGNYTATAFTSTRAGNTTDHLAAGASFKITLAASGTTSGRLFVPGGAEGGGDLDADMAGTWMVAGSTVRFTQAADTFVRDMPFIAEPNRLRGEAVFGDVTIRVTLSR